MDNQKDVTAATLKKPKIVFTPKNRMREAANAVEVSVDNPARKTGKESLTPSPSPRERVALGGDVPNGKLVRILRDGNDKQ